MGTTPFDRRLEAMLAVQERVTKENEERDKRLTMRFEELSREGERVTKENEERDKRVTKEKEERDKRVTKLIERVNETSKNLANWGSDQRKSYEELVSGVLKRHLESRGFTDVMLEEIEAYRKTGYFVRADGSGVDTAQWDGMVLCMKDGVEMVFLLEAKKTQNTKRMLKMPKRVARTMAFVGACHDGLVPEPGAKQRFKDICLMWRRCYGREVRGVLAADVIPESALDMAVAQGYITIRSGDGAFKVDDTQTGDSETVVPDESSDESSDDE
jgi:hypothetical protein